MLNLVGLIEPMLSSAGAYPLALCITWQPPSDDGSPCLENPRPEGAESLLTENVPSSFHAEPRHSYRPPRPRTTHKPSLIFNSRSGRTHLLLGDSNDRQGGRSDIIARSRTSVRIAVSALPSRK